MPDPVLRPARAAEYLGVHRTTLYLWVRQGALVAPIQLGERAVGWRQSQLDAFLSARQQAAEQAAE